MPRVRRALTLRLVPGPGAPALAAAGRRRSPATDFPAGLPRASTRYAEMVADVARGRRGPPGDRPHLLDRRELPGPRRCGPPRSRTTSAVDEPEPEVLFDGLTHADEHMGLEMTLAILHWLADGYGVGPADHRRS